MSIRILLSIEYNIYRKCLKNFLEKNDNICVEGEVCFLDDVENMLSENNYDIIITDMHMKNNIYSGDVINKIIINNKKIIALLPSDDVNQLNDMSLERFDAVMSLSAEIDKLVNVIHIVNNKGRYIDEYFIYKQKNGTNNKISLLTNREIEILKLIAKGYFNKEIASQMGITERTVKNHVSNIFKKIDVCDRTQAAIYAIRNNIIIL